MLSMVTLVSFFLPINTGFLYATLEEALEKASEKTFVGRLIVFLKNKKKTTALK